MGRPLLRLRRYLLPAFLPAVALVGLVALDGLPSGLLPAVAVAALVGQVRARWAWRLAARVRTFRALPGGPVALSYDPAVLGRYDLPALARQCGADLDRLAGWFGVYRCRVRLRRPGLPDGFQLPGRSTDLNSPDIVVPRAEANFSTIRIDDIRFTRSNSPT